MQQDDMFGETLAVVRDRMFVEARLKSTHCPCCDKHVKVYRRKFNSGMALMTIYLYRVFRDHPNGWLKVGRYLIKKHGYWPGDHGKLVWWGLMESKPEPVDGGAKTSGLYRMTPKGCDFALNKITVPSHAIEYMSNVESFDGDQINIAAALGKHFDYYELMREYGIAA